MLSKFLVHVDELNLATAINVDNIAYLEEQGDGKMHVHFVGTKEELIAEGQLAMRLKKLMTEIGQP
jgi:hypothetical protein